MVLLNAIGLISLLQILFTNSPELQEVGLTNRDSHQTKVKRSVPITSTSGPLLEPQEVPPEIQSELNNAIKNWHWTFAKKEGEGLELRCSVKVAMDLLKVFPKATYRLILNNKPFGVDPTRMMFLNGVLVFQSLIVEDTGLYLCELEYAKNKHKVVAFYSVVVYDVEPTVRVQATRSHELHCPSQFLGKLHKLAYRHWKINGTIYQGLRRIPAKNEGPDVIKEITHKMAGVWICEVIEPVQSKSWEVAFSFIQVDEEPAFWQKNIDYVQNNLKSVLITSAVVGGVIFLFIARAIYKRANEEKKQDESLESIKIQMMEVKKQGKDIETLGVSSGSSSGSGSDSNAE